MAAALLVSVTAFTATANAATCGANRICFYVHSNFGGSSYAHWNLTPGDGCQPVPPAYNDTFSSVINNTGYRLGMWMNAYCPSTAMPLIAQPHDTRSSFPWPTNDAVSSYKVWNP